MPPSEALNDDYVASLLLRDAEAHKKGHLGGDFGPSRSTKRRPDAPKPNTTFLRNIIRDTDSHNAALKAREESESRARMKQMRGHGSGSDRKRKAVDDEAGPSSGPEKRKRGGEREGRWAAALGQLGSGPLDRRRNESEVRSKEVVGNEMRSSRHRHSDSRRDRSRSIERDADEDAGRSRHRRRTDHRHSRSRSPHHRKEHRRRRRHHSQDRPRSPDPHITPKTAPRKARASASDSDSDTLDEFLGPKPPSQVRPRGRGAFKPSDMDTRFKADYNPQTDVGLDDEEYINGERADWDMALEALRDRAKWRSQGAERLRAAGFTQEEVGKWEKGQRASGDEKGMEDVKWAKKGEAREWDRGKAADASGETRLRPDWA